MRFLTEYLYFNTRRKREYIDITDQVNAAVRKAGIQEGMVLVSAMHITAGVYVNDAEDGLIQDIDKWLEGLAPFNAGYLHHQTGETNGDAHLKSLLVHHQVTVPVTDQTRSPLPAESQPAARPDEGLVTVTSPIVGIFFRSASPEAEPYVEVGSYVRKGQVLCIVEAMKLMNEIESEFDGRMVEILVENAKPVEFGEPLFRIEPGARPEG